MLSNELKNEIFDFVCGLQECGYTHDYLKAIKLTNEFAKLPLVYFGAGYKVDNDLIKERAIRVKYAYIDFTLSRHNHNKEFGIDKNAKYTYQEQLEYDIRGCIYYLRCIAIYGWNDETYCKFQSMILGIKNQLTNIKNYNYEQIRIRKLGK